MFKQDGKIFFETREEGEQYVAKVNAGYEKAKEDYFKALYAYVEGNSKAFVSYIAEHTPSEMVSANKWFIGKVRESLGR